MCTSPIQTERRGAMTLTVDLFISIISFGLSAFAIGYALGQSSNKTQK